MQIHQVLVRPHEKTVIILYVDVVGRRNSIVLDLNSMNTAQTLLAECQQKLPPDNQNPAKSQVEQEIGELEYRLSQLRQSIGQ
jgi:hypothetical protein